MAASSSQEVSPHLQELFGHTEKCEYYIRSSDHIIIFYERDGTRAEFPIPTNILLHKYTIFQTMFDPKILTMTRKNDEVSYMWKIKSSIYSLIDF